MADEIEAFRRLRTTVTDVLGFYELIYELDTAPTPVGRMMNEVHFTAAAHALALQVLKIIERFEGQED